MGKTKEKRIVERRPVAYSFLGGGWTGPVGGRSFNGHYRSTWGHVRITGSDSPRLQRMCYSIIVDGTEYMMIDPVVRTERGIIHVASRFARDVVNGRYENV